MEIRDEIVMQCPNCAVKHLSAAIAHRVCGSAADRLSGWGVLVARAAINLTEATEGYASHWDLAIGFLAMAEEACAADGDFVTANDIRASRVGLMEGADEARIIGVVMSVPTHSEMAFAHVEEAKRELKELDRLPFGGVTDFADAIASVREIYFPKIPAEGKGGEMDMACCAKKAKKAAVKGGSTAKKAACKGGKTCKGCKK